MTRVIRSAIFSPGRTWRYTLDRHWNGNEPHRTVLFVLLNPSTADDQHDDPTNRRGLRFARDWGYNGCVFVNLFALRSPLPSALKAHADPVGPDNDNWILQRVGEASLIVAAWGIHGKYLNRAREVRNLLSGYSLYHLGRTKGGQPRHILYLPADRMPELM